MYYFFGINKYCLKENNIYFNIEQVTLSIVGKKYSVAIKKQIRSILLIVIYISSIFLNNLI